MSNEDRPFRFPYLAGNGTHWEPKAPKTIREAQARDISYDNEVMRGLYGGGTDIDDPHTQLKNLLAKGGSRFAPTQSQIIDQSSRLPSGTINLYLEESNRKRKAEAREAKKAARRAG